MVTQRILVTNKGENTPDSPGFCALDCSRSFLAGLTTGVVGCSLMGRGSAAERQTPFQGVNLSEFAGGSLNQFANGTPNNLTPPSTAKPPDRCSHATSAHLSAPAKKSGQSR